RLRFRLIMPPRTPHTSLTRKRREYSVFREFQPRNPVKCNNKGASRCYPGVGRYAEKMWVRPPPHEKQGHTFMTDIVAEIRQLKKDKDTTILAHYYQDGEIQALADFTGDSLNLARAATKVTPSTIAFCG